MTTHITPKAALASASTRKPLGSSPMCGCRSTSILGPSGGDVRYRKRSLKPSRMMRHTEPSKWEQPWPRCAIDAAEALASFIDSPALIALGFDPSKALLDSAGQPRIANLAVHVGSHRRESVTVGECLAAGNRQQTRLCRMQFFTGWRPRALIGIVPLFVLNWMSGPGLRDAVGISLQNPKISPPGRKFRVSQSVSNVGEQGVGF
jgi:hypothetical protein